MECINYFIVVSYNCTIMANTSVKFHIIFYIVLSVDLIITEAIVTPKWRIERVEHSSNRDLIDITPKSSANQIFHLSHTLSCMNTFIKLFMDVHQNRIVVLLPEVNDADVTHIYLSKIQELRSVFVISNNLQNDTDHKTSLSSLIITPNHQHIKNSNINFIDLCGNGCEYAVIITDVYENTVSLLEEADKMVDLLWEKRIANVAILGTVNDKLLVYKSLGFESPQQLLRMPSSPVLIDQCYKRQSWTKKIDVFAPMKMNYSYIRLGYFEREPYVAVEKTDGGKVNYWGLEFDILYILKNKLEFYFYGLLITYENDTTIEDNVKAALYDSALATDLIAGGILWDPDDEIDYTAAYDVVQVVWLIPVSNNISLLGLITPLTDLVWFAVCGVLIFGIILKYLLFPHMSWLEIFSLVIGVAWYKQPFEISSRLIFMSWVIFGYILTQFYLASLAGQLMATADTQIDSMSDLLESGFTLGGTKTHAKMFEKAENGKNNDNSEDVLKAISQMFIVFSVEDYENQFRDLMDGVNTSVALAVTLNSSAMGNIVNQKVHTIKEVLASYPLAFPVWRGLPYLGQINQIIHRLIQNGLIDILGIRAARKSNSIHHYNQANNGEDDSFLELNDIAPGFFVLLIGYLAGGVCLLGEISIKKLTEYKEQKKRKKKKKKNKKIKMNVEKYTMMKMQYGKKTISNKKKQVSRNIIKSGDKVEN